MRILEVVFSVQKILLNAGSYSTSFHTLLVITLIRREI
jgi:hypothetical protein